MTKKIDICCVARNENLTIRDWVEYHLNIGFNRIWIFDNNNPDDFSLNETLKDYVDNGKVVIGEVTKGLKSFQLGAYNGFINFMKNYPNTYDWVGFIDCDEYFDFNRKKYKDVSEYFETVEKKCKDIGVLFVNWEIYGDNGQYFYEDKPVVERFPKPTQEKIKFYRGDDENWHIKSFLKYGVDGEFRWNPHNCFIKGKKSYNSDFIECSNDLPWLPKYSFKNAKIKHYQTKSLEEYIMRKFQSICADNEQNKPYTMDYYWLRNKKTTEALEALKTLCEKYNVDISTD